MSKALDFKSRVRSAELVLRLPREELAGHLLQAYHIGPRELISAHAFFKQIANVYEGVDEYAIRVALATAWSWLVVQGLIVKDPGQVGSNDFYVVTPKGAAISSGADFKTYRDAAEFPRHLIDPHLADKAWLNFAAGDYDTAVFQAFKEVEIAVRAGAVGVPDRFHGVDLMRRAFGPGCPLADASAPVAEQEGLASLFVGAFGAYRNPHSHRAVSIEATEAMELLVLATHLIRIARARGLPP